MHFTLRGAEGVQFRVGEENIGNFEPKGDTEHCEIDSVTSCTSLKKDTGKVKFLIYSIQ